MAKTFEQLCQQSSVRGFLGYRNNNPNEMDAIAAVKAQFKSAGRIFTGVIAVYGKPDKHGNILMPGALKLSKNAAKKLGITMTHGK